MVILDTNCDETSRIIYICEKKLHSGHMKIWFICCKAVCPHKLGVTKFVGKKVFCLFVESFEFVFDKLAVVSRHMLAVPALFSSKYENGHDRILPNVSIFKNETRYNSEKLNK